MFSRTRIRKELMTTGLKANFNNEQLKWIRDKTELLQSWKDTAVAEFTEVNQRLKTLENAVTIAQQKFSQIEARLTAIEDELGM